MTTPEGLGPRGSQLWTSFLEQHPGMSEPDQEVALEACRTADLLERLEEICRAEEPVVTNERGALIAHPAIVEARQQRNVLKMLVAALRLPDAATGKRPQVRSARGAIQPKNAGNVTALAKFRQASGG